LSAPNKVESDSYTSEDETLIVENNQARFEQERAPNGGINRMAYSVGEDLELAISLPRRFVKYCIITELNFVRVKLEY